MTRFWEFCDFLIMRELDTPDAIIRNYAIDQTRNAQPIAPISINNDFVRLGLKRVGLPVTNNTAFTCFSELLAALRAKGCYLNEIIVMGYLAQFYNYHRIKNGELKQWPKRPFIRMRKES